jgi:MFS family permease
MASRKSLFALDWFNFCLGDLGAGIGLYLSVYLLSQYHWDHASIGIALTALPAAVVITQIPIGILVDEIYRKRLVAVISLLTLAMCCLLIIVCHDLISVIAIQATAGIALAAVNSTTIGITMGLVDKEDFSVRVGRNGAFNNLGNVVISLCAAALGYFVSQVAIFLLLLAVALAGIFFVLNINRSEIDHDRARESSSDRQMKPIQISQLLQNKAIIILSLTLGLWQLANSALCPTAAQYIAETNNKLAGLSMAACILTGQLVMIPMAIITGKFAHKWGRKPLLETAFIVLPIRALLYTLTSNPLAIVAIQLLDGVGAGIIIVLTSIMAADLAEGTGRYNVTRSISVFTQGIGVSLSNLLTGWLIANHGYNFTFTTLAIIAVLAFLLCHFAVRETYNKIAVS